ncbi:MAG TPA: cell division protein FtsZ [Verrucomicrobiae bacterium]|jgi:cell division protein FtsZ
MNTNTEKATPIENSSPRTRTVKMIGVGGAGVILADAMNSGEFAGASFAVVDTDAQSLAASSATVKIHLETKLLRGLGTGGDPDRGRALAEEQYPVLKSACEGADVVFIIAGLGGGAGSGITPVLARAAREAGAIVFAFVTLPFAAEFGRREHQAQQGLEHLKAVADGVICLPNQKATKLMDDNTPILDTFRMTGSLLIEGVRGVWQLLMRPGLIQIHFEDVCALVRDRHSESAFAFVEASGPARSREVVEKLLAHPLLDEGKALASADAILVSVTGGKEMTMADVGRVTEQIGRYCNRAQIIMGAAIDPEMKNRLSVTLIAAKNGAPKIETAENAGAADTSGLGRRRGAEAPSTPALTMEQREHIVARHGRGRRDKTKMLQTQLPLAIVSKGRFDKSEPTIHKGEDLDIPTYIRKGIQLN